MGADVAEYTSSWNWSCMDVTVTLNSVLCVTVTLNSVLGVTLNSVLGVTLKSAVVPSVQNIIELIR